MIGNTIITIILTSFIQLCSLVGVIFLVGFVLGYLQDLSRSYWTGAFGRVGFLLTAWIGTPIHEFGHALMCVVFRHQIVNVQWFPTNTTGGQLGFVSHRYNPNSMYQKVGNFFIGVAPVFTGIASLIILMHFFVPQSYDIFVKDVAAVKIEGTLSTIVKHVFSSSILLWKSLFTSTNFARPTFWFFLFLAICISTHIALSRADIEGAISGLVAIYITLFILNSTAYFLHISSTSFTAAIGTCNAYFFAFSSVALIFACINLLISYILYTFKRILS